MISLELTDRAWSRSGPAVAACLVFVSAWLSLSIASADLIEPEVTAPRVVLRQISRDGSVSELPWKAEATSSSGRLDGVRVRISFPDPTYRIHPEDSDQPDSILLKSESRTLRVMTPKGKSSVLVVLRPSGRWVSISEHCREARLQFDADSLDWPKFPSWLGVDCSRKGTEWSVSFNLPTDYELSTAKKDSWTVRRKGSLSDSVRISASSVVSSVEAPVQSSRWSKSLSLGPTQMIFTQSDAGIEVKQLNLTAKFSLVYRPEGARWDLGASGFGTLAPMSVQVSTPSLEPSRQIGLNLRGAYHFENSFLGWSPSLSMGWYGISMVGQTTYGFSMLSAFQTMATLRREVGPQRYLYGYFRLAPILTALSQFSLSQRDESLGAGFSFMALKRSWSLTFDISDLKVGAPVLTDSYRLKTWSLGLQVSL